MTQGLNYKHTIYASYLGYITQAIVNNLAPLLFLIFKDSFGIPIGKITLLITVNFFIQLIVDLLSARFVDKIGYKVCIVFAHISAAAGIGGLAVFPYIFPDAYMGMMTAVVLYAVGGGLIEVLVSPIVEACPTDNKASVMSLLHSFYCWGTVAVIGISTLSMSLLGKENWMILACIWALVPVFNAVYFSLVPIETLTEEGEGMSFKELFSMNAFWIFFLLMITAGASEQSMSQWASAFAESGLGVSKTVGDLAGPCMFAVFMGSARVFYAKFSERIDLLSFIVGSGVLCIFSYLLAVISPSPALSLAGCALSGLSVGILWPGVFSLASARYPRGGTAMFALLALAGDLGCSGGPTLVGMVSGLLGDNLKTGLAAALVFPALLVLCGILYRKMQKHDSKDGIRGGALAPESEC